MSLLDELTVDIQDLIFSCLDCASAAAFAQTCWSHLLVHQNRVQRQGAEAPVPKGGATVSLPLGMGFIDRPRFLRPRERSELVALVSYPRSGNSMLRGMLDRVTGVVTGSDTRPDRVLSRSLLRTGLRGEGVVDDRAWVIKTHWPERYGYKRFDVNRVILLVRNPFGAIDSYFNMSLTNTHEKSLREDLYTSLQGIWDEMIRHEVNIWAKFNAWWLTKGVPVFAVRYEDIVAHPEEMLVRIVSFLERISPEAVRASPYMDRIQAAVNSRPKRASKPRSGGLAASLRHYTDAQVEAMCQLQGKALRAFGYDPQTQGFPHSMPMLPPMEKCVKFLDNTEAMMAINKGRMIRKVDDKFGRSVTKLRHALTDFDRRPLPTVDNATKHQEKVALDVSPPATPPRAEICHGHGNCHHHPQQQQGVEGRDEEAEGRMP